MIARISTCLSPVGMTLSFALLVCPPLFIFDKNGKEMSYNVWIICKIIMDARMWWNLHYSSKIVGACQKVIYNEYACTQSDLHQSMLTITEKKQHVSIDILNVWIEHAIVMSSPSSERVDCSRYPLWRWNTATHRVKPLFMSMTFVSCPPQNGARLQPTTRWNRPGFNNNCVHE